MIQTIDDTNYELYQQYFLKMNFKKAVYAFYEVETNQCVMSWGLAKAHHQFHAATVKFIMVAI